MRHVLMVQNGTLLEEGMEALLLHESDFQVSGIVCKDETSFVQEVSSRRPDVVLLNEEGRLDSRRILELLGAVTALSALRVLIVRPDANTIDMYEKKQVVARQIDDLLSLIR